MRGYTDTTGGASNGKMVTVQPDVIFQELGDEVVVANLDSGVYYVMNEVAARIWELLCNASNIDEVVKAMLDEYEVDEETLRADTRGLVDDLQKHGLIQINDA